MLFALKVDVVRESDENSLIEVMADLFRYVDMTELSWRETGVVTGGGNPEIEVTAPLPVLMHFVQNYFGGDGRVLDRNIPWADVLETLKSIQQVETSSTSRSDVTV